MLDDLVGDTASRGGVQCGRRCGSHLVDHADEWAASHRRPYGEDSDSDHLAVRLGDDDRRGGDEEEVAEEVRRILARPGLDVGRRDESGGGIEIRESGAADAELHVGLSRCSSQRALLDDRLEG